MVRAPEKFLMLNSGQDWMSNGPSVQYYYTVLLSHEAGMKVDLKTDSEEIIIRAS